MQQRVFEVIGLSKDEAESKFGFLLEAFRYGPPPHGGIAFGLDRLAATLVGTDAIREVMAFPKASSGGDPLTEPISAATASVRPRSRPTSTTVAPSLARAAAAAFPIPDVAPVTTQTLPFMPAC